VAEDINSCTVVGRLTRDAELKHTNGGSAVTKFSIAVNRSVKKGEQWEEEASFFDVSLWGRRAESLNQYLTRGSRVAVIGELRQDRWEQDGQSRSRVFIHANNIQLLGDKQQGGQQQGNNQGSESYPSGNPTGQDNFEDTIPF
jgi:single-strand DNA-binding protein